jgi:dipeptidyl-peptidase-4
MVHPDMRAVKDLWVINSIASPRPTLETYKYHMPGEKESPVEYVLLFDLATKTSKELDVKQFKDQDVGLSSAPLLQKTRDEDYAPSMWLDTNDKFYLTRTSGVPKE